MSKIELRIEVDADNVADVKQLLGKLTSAEAKGIKVKDAEVVEPEEEEPKKAPAKKAAPKKPAKVVEPEPEEEEEFEIEEEEAEEIDLEDLKALQATKVVKHKEAIVAKFKKYGATRLSDVDPKHYADYEKFLNGLK